MSHLAEHVDDLIEKGMNEIDAEKAAIKTFGSPREAALNLMNQGSRWRLGGAINTIAAVALIVGMVMGTIAFQTFTLNLPYDYNVRQAYMGIFGGVIALSILGGLISRKVEIRKFGVAWVIGLVLSAGYLLAGPEKHFGDIVPSQFPKQLALWKQGNAATRKIAALADELENAYGQDGLYYYNDRKGLSAEQKKAALEVISNKVPELLKIKPSYIQLSGKLTSGYLVPTSGNVMDHYNGRRYYSGEQQGGFQSPTGDIFPWTMANLKYVKTSEEAIEAWRDSFRNFYGLREFGAIAQRQEMFIINSEMVTQKTRTEMAWATLLPLAGSSLLYVIFMIAGSWLTSKVPNLTFHSSFRRRLA
jgi:hypothetical protein